MDYRIAVCDDCAADADFAARCAAEWAHRLGHTAELLRFPSAEAFLFHYAEDKRCDILLLDVEMPGLSGVKLAKRIREENDALQIVFITGYTDYIAEGYDVSALHYLVKPVSREKLCAVFDRAAERLKSAERALLLELPGETARVPLHAIDYLEVRQNYVTVHADKEYTVKKTLGAMERALDDRFFRAGRSYILNLSRVRSVTKNEVLLVNGARIPLPRGMYEPLNRAIIQKM